MPDTRKYSDDEVRSIIERAVSSGSSGDATDINHADLLAIGEQIGVSAGDMERAARDVSQAKLDILATRSIKSRRRKLLAAHAGLFALFNGLFFAVNFFTTPGEWWFLFSAVFWGLALALHAGLALGLNVSAGALQRERRKLQAKGGTPARLRIDDQKAATGGALDTSRRDEADGLEEDTEEASSRKQVR